MKGKFRLMWRVGLALVLALSLSLVMAVPVSAAVSEPEVTFATDDQAAPGLADADYTIKFVSGVALATTDTITIEFPAGTTLGTIAGTVETKAISGPTVSGQRVSITVPLGADIIAGETVDVALTGGITNPADGDYTLEVYTSKEPTAVTSATYIISKPLTNVNAPTLTPTTVGATATYAIPFTTTEDMRSGDAIVIEFPVDTDISTVVSGDVTGVTVASISIDGQVLTITLGGDLSAGAQTVTVANHITNPTTRLNPSPLTNEWKLTVYTTYGHRIPVLSAAYTLTAGTVVSQVDWSTVDEYVPNAIPSDAFVIQTQTQYGNAADVAAITTFTLTASSGAFYSDSGCGAGTVITSIVIAGSASESANFYYKGATATVGTVTITADETPSQGWDIASTTILVNPKLELWGGGELKASYATFVLAIADALPYDTIKVPASTYDVGTLAVNKPYLTIESISGSDTTIIRGAQVFYTEADNLVLGGAAGKGFTFVCDVGGVEGGMYIRDGADDIEISYNAIDTTAAGTATRGISTNSDSANITGLTVSHNTFTLTDEGDQGIRAVAAPTQVNWTITDNTFTGTYPTVVDQSAIQIDQLSIATLDTIISGNEITGVAFGVAIGLGQLVCHDSTSAALEISGNTFDGSDYGIYLINVTGTDQDVVITENTFTDNNYGFTIGSDTWEPAGFTVRYNDFSGNTCGIDNNTTTTGGPEVLVAEHNYWGDVTGPYHATTNPDGLGDEVSDNVDYSPWLNASGGGATSTDTITLVTGWNLISLPLIPVDSDIDTVLAGVGTGVTVNKVAYFTGGPAGDWLNYISGSPGASDLTTMNDGKGYWIDVSAAGELTVIGFELALPGYAPPDYDVVVGWNLIGFTSTTVKTVNVYLGSVFDTVEAMYEYNASSGLYEAILTGESLALDHGYWLAVNTAGTIYP